MKIGQEEQDIDGDALWAHAMGEADAGDAGAQPTDGDAGQPRDDAGRFAAQDVGQPAAGAAQEPAAPQEPATPAASTDQRMADAMEALRTGQADLAAKLLSAVGQPKPAPTQEAPPADHLSSFLEDPNKFVEQQISRAMEGHSAQMQEVVDFYSRKQAVADHGEERVSQAHEAFAREINAAPPEVQARVLSEMRKSRDPYGDVIGWYARYEENSNPQIKREREVKRLLEDPATRAMLEAEMGRAAASAPQAVTPQAAAQPAGNVLRIPPSLNRATSAASAAAAAPNEPSDAELFAATTARR